MNNLIEFLHSIYPLTDELKHHLLTILKVSDLPKKSFFLKQGQICRNIGFVEKGLLRCFYERHEKEVCSWFMKEGDVIISVESFFKQVTSYENIQALEDCSIHYIGYDELQYIYHHFSEFNYIGRILTERYYTQSEQRLYAIRMQKTLERYGHLIETYPEYIQRIPSKYIASYLGVSEETLSRNRAKK